MYQFDKSRLRRLCRSCSDPKELLAALGRLTGPIPAGQGFDLQLPKGVTVRPQDFTVVERTSKSGGGYSRSLLGAMTVLGDSAGGQTMPPRALVIISPGHEGTSITPEDLADRGVAANVPIYPVALPAQSILFVGSNPVR